MCCVRCVLRVMWYVIWSKVHKLNTFCQFVPEPFCITGAVFTGEAGADCWYLTVVPVVPLPGCCFGAFAPAVPVSVSRHVASSTGRAKWWQTQLHNQIQTALTTTTATTPPRTTHKGKDKENKHDTCTYSDKYTYTYT